MDHMLNLGFEVSVAKLIFKAAQALKLKLFMNNTIFKVS